ncbi:hypothetical protein [Bradyrhizobium erythrophlei]|uniref:DUF2130 domain-containing protein n=1 Tax=Bradyrhizobium erythrophlei TaxID=1437360 RepID=A0A1M5SGW1_9BRAD|nr:hypothetical protein [Bradyrhizobium erythrophlei]SHH37756.1 hypothetical protein SAMN05444169_7142 [Bradyrhizobium erythrophlei]
MTEPQIICPNCSHEIKLTESLAAPLIEETRKRFSEQLAAKDAEVSKKEEALRVQQGEIARALESIEDQNEVLPMAGISFQFSQLMPRRSGRLASIVRSSTG